MSRNTKNIRYLNGIIRPTDHGTFRAEIFHDGKKHRCTEKTIEAAKTWLEIKRNELDVPGALSPADYHDAARARALLPANVTILDAIRFYVDHNVAGSATMKDAAADWNDHKKKIGLRSRTISSARSRINSLAAAVPDETVASITTSRLSQFLDDRQVGGSTRNGFRVIWIDFFQWCRRQGWCSSNPAEDLPVVRLDQKIPGILTIKQIRAMLGIAATNEPRLVPYLAIAFFAGIRPEELARLDWSAISNHIHIGPAVAKVRRQRFVTIPKNLAAWLKRYKSTGRIQPWAGKAMRLRMVELRKAAGIANWPHDALRHCFASYHLALHKDAGRTAHELGHQSPSTLYAHYRALVTDAAAIEYFSLTPRVILAKEWPTVPQVQHPQYPSTSS